MNIPSTICPGCFTNKGNVAVCGSCGYDESERRSPLVLPHRTVLQGQFLVGKVLGKPGGFGITYLAMDMKLKVKVAIKEYLPRDLAGREANSATVYPHSKEDADFFAKGLDDFLKEAQNLAQFDHANIVRVRNFFKENATAYIVMDYYDGITLMEYIQRMGGKIEWQMAIKIMTPIMDALREVHSKGFLHRDIKPQNIYLTKENRIILLDFGSARQAMGERSKSLSMIFTPGFAAFEQYHRRGNQGPWTDVYGVAATIYFMITGDAPPEANGRIERDNIQLPSQMMITMPQSVEKGLMKGLAVKAGDRFDSVQGLQRAFAGIVNNNTAATETQKQQTTDFESDSNRVYKVNPPKQASFPTVTPYKRSPNKLLLASCAVFLILTVVVLLNFTGKKTVNSQTPTSQSVEDKITNYIDTLNAKTPYNLGSGMRLDFVSRDVGKNITHKITLLDYSSTDIVAIELISSIKPKIKEIVCTSEGYNIFLIDGYNINYVNSGNDANEIGRFSISPADCGK